MRTNKVILFLSTLLMGALGGYAQESTHWLCDIYSYQYDMTVYFDLEKDGTAVSNRDDFEVAAFVGSECRGVGEFLTVNGTANYGYLRVRSNVSEGEQISFKVYQKTTRRVLEISEILDFNNQGIIGLPSSPFILNLPHILLGDVNKDGLIDAKDVVDLVNYMMGKKELDLNAADVNGDGEVNSADVIMTVNAIMNK
jgi:hypothetical protein